MASKPPLRIGLIGTGFMGKTHVFGFAAAPRVFDLPYEIVLHAVADRTDALAGRFDRIAERAKREAEHRAKAKARRKARPPFVFQSPDPARGWGRP